MNCYIYTYCTYITRVNRSFFPQICIILVGAILAQWLAYWATASPYLFADWVRFPSRAIKFNN